MLQCNVERVCLVEQNKGVGRSSCEVVAFVYREWDSWINNLEMHKDGCKFPQHVWVTAPQDLQQLSPYKLHIWVWIKIHLYCCLIYWCFLCNLLNPCSQIKTTLQLFLHNLVLFLIVNLYNFNTKHICKLSFLGTVTSFAHCMLELTEDWVIFG